MKKLLLFSLLLIISCREEPEIIPECTLTDDQLLVVEELNDALHPFNSSSPSDPEEELAALDPLFSQAKVVALGEATHGTLEFFEMKHRLFKYLVEQHDFRAIVFEATWGGTLAVNNYVINGIGELDNVVDQMQFWTWDTQEVKTMIEWLRVYNYSQPDDQKVYFYGSDCQSMQDELNMVLSYLENVDPTYKSVADSLYQPFYGADFDYANESEEFKNDVKNRIAAVVQGISDKFHDYVLLSDSASYEMALQAAVIIQQVEEVFSGRNRDARDIYMGQNTLWASDFIGNAKVVWWGHNHHVATNNWGWTSTGLQLESELGDEFVNVGFSFSAGSFNAVETFGANSYGQLKPHYIIKPQCRSTNHLFEAAEPDNFYLIINELTQHPKLHNWLVYPNYFLNIGSTYNSNAPQNYYTNLELKGFYDVIVHFDKTRASEF